MKNAKRRNERFEGIFQQGFCFSVGNWEEKRKSPIKISNGFGYFCRSKVPRKEYLLFERTLNKCLFLNMNYNKAITSIFLCLGLLAGFQIFGQRVIGLKRSIHLESSSLQFYDSKCDYELLLPTDRPGKQEVLEYKYSVEPSYIIKENRGEYIPKWKGVSFAQLKKADIDAEVIIRIHKYDLTTAKQKPIKNIEDNDTLNYLKAESNFQVTSQKIVEVANKIDGNTREEIVHKFFDYVVNHMEYYNFLEEDRGAEKALKQGKGDCTEYSELMVTLSRVKGIPAKIIKGFIPLNDGGLGYHNWVEVYFSQYGWVAFDPTHADHPNSKTTFSTMENKYIECSDRRFIKHTACSCNNKDYGFTYKVKDTCFDVLKGKFDRMVSLYEENKLQETLSVLDTLLHFTPDNYKLWMYKGISHARLNNFDTAIISLQAAIIKVQSPIEKASVLYAFANYFALKGEPESAISYIKESIKLGLKPNRKIIEDEDFQKIKDYPAYIELQKEMKAKLEQNKK